MDRSSAPSAAPARAPRSPNCCSDDGSEGSQSSSTMRGVSKGGMGLWRGSGSASRQQTGAWAGLWRGLAHSPGRVYHQRGLVKSDGLRADYQAFGVRFWRVETCKGSTPIHVAWGRESREQQLKRMRLQGSLNNVRRRASVATATAVSGSAGRDNSFAGAGR